jgi:BMFP domain-containing protein YqiC
MQTPDLEQLVERIMQSLPRGVQEMKQEADDQLRAALKRTLANMDLVTREEFDIQREVLLRTRSKLEALEQQVAALEQALNNTEPTQE